MARRGVACFLARAAPPPAPGAPADIRGWAAAARRRFFLRARDDAALARRHGLHLSFCSGWLTPEEAGCVGFPLEKAKDLTPTQRRLLGYACYDDAKQNAVRLWTLDYEDIPAALGWDT